jgi:catechol 2,3-dioxygenase-like lactoylglutathione lyase family enzyme
MTLAECSIIGFVPVSDLAAAEAFYGGTLGLPVVGNDGFALALTAPGGSMIRCALTPDAMHQPFTILGWEVADIHASASELMAAGVKPIVYPYFKQGDDGVWTAPDGSKVLWFHDPDGNVLSLSQHAHKKAIG